MCHSCIPGIVGFAWSIHITKFPFFVDKFTRDMAWWHHLRAPTEQMNGHWSCLPHTVTNQYLIQNRVENVRETSCAFRGCNEHTLRTAFKQQLFVPWLNANWIATVVYYNGAVKVYWKSVCLRFLFLLYCCHDLPIQLQ